MQNHSPGQDSEPSQATCRILLVVPGKVNYFYDLYAQWLAEGLRSLGAEVALHELPAVPPDHYDLAILSNVAEILHAVGDAPARRQIAALRLRVDRLMNRVRPMLDVI